MKYLFVFVTILIVWIASLIISSLLPTTEERLQLYAITMVFTVLMYLLGFLRRV